MSMWVVWAIGSALQFLGGFLWGRAWPSERLTWAEYRLYRRLGIMGPPRPDAGDDDDTQRWRRM